MLGLRAVRTAQVNELGLDQATGPPQLAVGRNLWILADMTCCNSYASPHRTAQTHLAAKLGPGQPALHRARARLSSAALGVLLALADGSVDAATFVSFQEGDVRMSSDKATVGTNGTLVDAAYNMGGTALRTYYPAAPQEGIQLIVGNNITTTNRSLLSFNLSYLTNLAGTNFVRIDSVALILTHDDAGLGTNAVQSVHLTAPFAEATATWNNPHGGSTNAGGVVGMELRERGCTGTNVSPGQEIWGSPATFWTNGGTGPDLLVEAVRGALTNASKTLYLLVKRKTEAGDAFFARYQHDGDPDVNFRPELIVGVDSTLTNPPAGLPTVTLTASDPSATESGGDSGAFTLQRTGATDGALTVNYTVSGTASNGVDYATLSGTTNFAPGVTNLVIAVVPLDDSLPEPEETVILTLSTNAAYVIGGSPTATVRIADDGDLPMFTVTASTPFAYEATPAVNGAFTISRRPGDTNSAVTVQVAFSGTASNGVDYTASVTNSLLFSAGVASRDVIITPLDDALTEGSETVVLTLLSGAGYVVGAPASATVTILDNESSPVGDVLLEAESFTNRGGWVVDAQFMDLVGSSYLLAHGYGKPVDDARTTAQFSSPGTYRLWVRTKDWTAPLTDHPGSFKVAVNGVDVPVVFGTVGQGWLWQDGGLVQITNLAPEVRLRDLTGFEGRCDALLFAANPLFVPTNTLPALTDWRRQQLGAPAVPPTAGSFDVVIAGGGIAGTAAAIAAARQGLSVALLQDRPVLGGNASQEIRVATQGAVVSPIVEQINSTPHANGDAQAIADDATRLQVVQSETNLHLFLEWRAFRANTNGSSITSLDARQTSTGQERRFNAPLFIDSTGDGWIGYWAGAQYRMGREAQAEFNEPLAPTNSDLMTSGSTLMWRSQDAGQPVAFPAVPWATNVSKGYVATSADWNWEYGLNRDTIYDAEEIRDHLFQAIYGTFYDAKKNVANTNLQLSWVPYVAGKRESRRLVGDYVLTEADVRNHPAFPDAVAMGSWSIDLHYTQAGAYDFLTGAAQASVANYWVPFRCLYSTNVSNLMMAGRCLSATHVGLGSPRVMNTCGQMGVAVGMAAALCKQYNTTPRGVYQTHTTELRALMGLTTMPVELPPNTVTIVDNADPSRVQLTGAWTSSSSVAGYYGTNYLHDGNTAKGTKSVLFQPDVPACGSYRVYLRWAADANRSTNTPVDINGGDGLHTVTVNQATNNGLWNLVGTFPFVTGHSGNIVIRTTGTTGYVIADAVLLAADFGLDPRFTGTAWQDDDGDGVANYAQWLPIAGPLVFATVGASNTLDVLNGTNSIPPSATVNFTVQAADNCLLLTPPAVTLRNGATALAPVFLTQDPAGVFQYAWTPGLGTTAGLWNGLAVGTNFLGLTATNHFTLNVAPALGTISGALELEGFVGTNGTATFVATGGAGPQTNVLALVFTNAGPVRRASYTLTVPLTTSHLSAKTPRHLRRRLPVSFTSGTAATDFTGASQLPGGDLDNSNTVDAADYQTLVLAWYQRASQPDGDGNGAVDLDDYFILANNWLRDGDAE